MKKRVLLIGVGPTTSLITYNIKKCSNLSDILELHVWEKARGTGGRFSTFRCPKNQNSYADFGAQYLTQSQTWSKPYFEGLEKQGLLTAFNTVNISGFRGGLNSNNYVCPKGTSSIVKNFLQQSDIESLVFNTKVRSIAQRNISGKNVIEVEAIESPSDNIKKEYFDIVISTIPIPQVLEINHRAEFLPENDLKSKLQTVKFTSRFALGLFYDGKIDLKANEKILNFTKDNPIIRYWSLENAKRAAGTENLVEPAAITVHTSVEFGAENIEKDGDSMQQMLLEKTKNVIKSIENNSPNFVRCHKWRYSQVALPYPESPGFIEIIANPLLILSGDSTSYSGFEGCILSAEKTVTHIRDRLL